MKNYSSDLFCDALLSESRALDNIYFTDNVNTQVEVLSAVFLKCLNFCAPLVTKELKRPFAPWLHEELRTLIQQKNCFEGLKKNLNNICLENTFKDFKCQVRRSIHYSKSEYYNKKLGKNKGNSKLVWKTINEVIPNNKRSNQAIICDNKETMMQTANLFNDYFANVGKSTFEKTYSNDSTRLPTTDSLDNIDPNCLFSNMDNKKVSLVTICNLSKAFDSISYDILLKKKKRKKKSLKCDVDPFWL